MADDRNSPEKQLLRLIEEKKSAGKSAPPNAPGLKQKISLANFFGQLAGRLSFFTRSSRRRSGSGGPNAPLVNLAIVNQALMAVAAALLIYLVSDATAAVIQLGKPINLAPMKETAAALPTQSVSPLNDSAYYLQKVTSRDLFKEGGAPAPKKTDEPAPAEDYEATSHFSLVGISWSANPDVIIEDKDSKRTFFVRRGQTLSDGIKVEAIFKDHVVLSRDGQEFELR